MKNLNNKTNNVSLKDNLIFAGTIYDSFEALEEVLGKLKLEQPLFLVYLAKKAYAEEVLKAAGEEKNINTILNPSQIEINVSHYQHLQ